MNVIDALIDGYFHTRNNIFIKYKTRDMIKKLQSKYGNKKLTGIEIGTAYGEHAFMILNNLNIKTLYCIDVYKKYNEYSDFLNHKTDIMYNRAKNLLSKYNNQVIFIKKFSDDAINDIKEHVDFVYIDANHTYNYVKRDIELYYPKVKLGGIIGGHDFTPAYGVPYAVLEFAEKNGLLDKLGGGKIDWWIEKIRR